MKQITTDPTGFCYSCDAVVPLGEGRCPACGADQSSAAQELHKERENWGEKTELWRVAMVCCALIMLGVGVLVGRWTATSTMSIGDRMPAPTATWDQVNSMFVEQIDGSLSGIYIESWVAGPNCSFTYATDELRRARIRRPENPACGIVIEMKPPTAQDPLRLWQVLDAEEREAITGLMAVSYTRALLAGGIRVDPARRGHPRIEIRYRGLESPLAVREESGEIRVFSSPYDQGTTRIGGN